MQNTVEKHTVMFYCLGVVFEQSAPVNGAAMEINSACFHFGLYFLQISQTDRFITQ